ncbi:hypothetical protein KA005_11965 [bacterium]|nr:hypothetical protein [bacterium]
MKRIDVKEFQDFGFLQEVNRQFFHPLGLALEVIVDLETGEVTLGGVWDARDDPEGYLFSEEDLLDLVCIQKMKNVRQLWDDKAKVRLEGYGYVVQPILA